MPGWQPLTGFCDPLTKVTREAGGDPCDFEAIIQLIKNGIHDLVLLSTLLAISILVYAGFLWLTSRGDTGQHKKALGMLGSVVWGYVWILAAWVVVYSITSVLLKDSFNFLLAP